MDYRLALAICTLSLLVLAQSQTQTSPCQRTFLNSLMNCAQNTSINFLNLQYLVANGTKGQRPQENIQQFKFRACAAQTQIDRCAGNTYLQLENSTMCLNPMDQQQLTRTSADTFGNYDVVCSLPCRHNVMHQVRQCFTQNNLDPKMYVDNAWGRGAVLGTDWEQVYQFCRNRQMVIQCIREQARLCPDVNKLFHRMGMEVTGLEKGIELLCQMPRLYLEGLDCYRNPTPEIQMCIQTSTMNNMNNKMKFQQTKNDHLFRMKTCSLRMQQVSCEREGWSRRQQVSCNKAIIGLRNELQCKIFPSWCMQHYLPQYHRFCNPVNFYLEERKPYAGAGALVVTWSTVAILVVFGMLSSA